jgi:small GTP-binding protein
MSLLRLLRPRMIILFLLWSLPVLLAIVLGSIALYQQGWLAWIVLTLPLMWVIAWVASKVWKPRMHQQAKDKKPFKVPEFWTATDAAAVQVVDAFRAQIPDVDRMTITDPHRYLLDAQNLARALAKHYHAKSSDNVFHPLTPVEILAVIHLAVEDLEEWVLENVPGSNLATIGQLEKLPTIFKALDIGQSVMFLASAIADPTRLLAYPLWRKSGQVTVELQNELLTAFYQRYLRQMGKYLIEMYSGRLKAGSRRYRQQFGHLSSAVHATGGDTSRFDDLKDTSTTIAVMGQVKAGKSSLINALMQDQVAATSVLPETREVQRFQYQLPDSGNSIALLDTPGYSEADVTKQQKKEIKSAADSADIILLVLAANNSARETDVQMVRELREHYRKRPHLKSPPIIAVLTHIDLLRPVREWSPPYDWRKPNSPKAESIAGAVAYVRELFGKELAGFACVYTGDEHSADSSVADEVVPQLVAHLDHGHSAAILKAFYQQLNRQRFQQLSQQVVGLLKNAGKNLFTLEN